MYQPTAMGTNSSDVKLHNLSAILLSLLQHENVSRVYLAQVLGVSTATITNLVSELMNQGLITEDGVVRVEGQPTAGRPQRALHLVPDARCVTGFHIDIGTINISLSDTTGNIIASRSFDYDVRQPWHEVMDTGIETIQTLLKTQQVKPATLLGVGVGASGLVDPFTGVNVIAPNLNWRDVPLRDYLATRLDLPVIVDNNVRAMALGESLFGSGRGSGTMAFIYARVGVGAGLVINGQVYRGAGTGAGEIGHTHFVFDDSHRQHVKTLESLISRPAILEAARDLATEYPDSRLAQVADESLTLAQVFEIARQGDSTAREMLRERAFFMGIALANLVNTFNPELIVLGGIFTREPDVMLPVISQTMQQYAFSRPDGMTRLTVTPYGNTAGMVGASALALDSFFYRPQAYLRVDAAG